MNIDILESANYTKLVVERLTQSLKSREPGKRFHLFLSGGSTPKAVYAGLAKQEIDWSEVHLWWGDERFVPPDHPDSNYRMVREQLLDEIEVSPLQVHAWPILSSPELSAETYDREFREYFESQGESLDLQILGMGDDGHTASLFPGTSALGVTEQMCVSNRVEGKESVRLTLTFPALALSQRVVFLITGGGKAEAVKSVLEDRLHPASRVQGAASTEFWLDKQAAAKLSQ
ncbi:MAG: 6-phosphogluconolactonase [Vulcanimicrobiota bacterium]